MKTIIRRRRMFSQPWPPAWMYSKDWNLLKVIARGTDAQNEQITVKLSNDAVILLLR